MKCVFLVFFHAFLLCTTVVGQSSVEGCVVGSKNEPLVGASVILLRKSDSSVFKGTVSTRSGDFRFSNIDKGNYVIKISSLGYKTLVKYVTIKSPVNVQLGNLILSEKAQKLSDFVVIQHSIIAEQKGDTSEFNAASFKVNKDAVAEDLVTKLPGVTVENGTVKAQGEEVKQILVDNKEFFGNDASIALKNLPADIIDKIQLYDKSSEESMFTGFKDSETTKTLNIKTKRNRNNGTFGKMAIAYGSDDRYKINGTLNFFNGARRISLVGGSNNVNEQNFSSQDILNVGKPGGMRPGPMSNNSAFLGQNGGINTNHTGGINYSDQWGSKWTATGSYFYNQTNNESNSSIDRTYFINDSTNQYYKAKTSSNAKNYNHRVNMRLECKIDSMSSLLILPSVSFQKNNSSTQTEANTRDNNQELLQSNSSNVKADNEGYNLSNTVLYRRKFAKKGRALFIDFSQAAGDKETNSLTVSDLNNQQSDASNKNWELSSRISYTEPLGKYSLLKMMYAPSTKENELDKLTNNFDSSTNAYTDVDTELSNHYKLKTTTQRGGLAYLFNRKKVNFNVGSDYQSEDLDGTQISPTEVKTKRNFSNWLMHSDLFYTINKRTNFHIGYNTSTTNPSLTQLQDVIDNSNELNLTQGNPDLKQQLSHEIRCMYRSVDYTLTRTFFLMAHGNFSNNYIGNESFTASTDTVINGVSLAKGSELSRSVNLIGYINIEGFAGYSFPVYLIKTNVNLNAGYSFSQLPGIINNEKNYASTSSAKGSVNFVSNISERVDFNFAYRANYNWVTNSIQTSSNQNYYSGNASAKVNLVPITHWVISSDVNLNHYLGLGDEYDKAYILWNGSLAYKFMKNDAAELRFTVYDLLNQNKSVNRTVNDTYIEDSKSEVLKQYFMISFSYNLRNFKNT